MNTNERIVPIFECSSFHGIYMLVFMSNAECGGFDDNVVIKFKLDRKEQWTIYSDIFCRTSSSYSYSICWFCNIHGVNCYSIMDSPRTDRVGLAHPAVYVLHRDHRAV